MDPMHNTTHYGHSMVPAKLIQNATDMAKSLCKLIREGSYNQVIVCYRGMSGIATATAIMFAMGKSRTYKKYLDRVVWVYVRKVNENSHGLPVEISNPPTTVRRSTFDVADPAPVIFVDDFIATGVTRDITIAAIVKEFSHKKETQQRVLKGCKFSSLTMWGGRVHLHGLGSRDLRGVAKLLQ